MGIKEYIEKQNISVSKMAGDLGISIGYASRVIRNLRRPGPELAERIEEWSSGQVSRMEILYPGISEKERMVEQVANL